MEKLILASCSPRRSELLTSAGIPFETVSPDVDESCDLPAGEAVAVLSARKARAVGRLYPGRRVLAADTLVAVDGRPLGKPADAEDAVRMLRLLSGRTHEVYTGLCLRDKDGCVTEAERTSVRFRTLTDGEIRRYIQTSEPMDKAGAYGIQGKAALFVEAIEGDYYNVVGLPLCRLGRMLAGKGVPVL